MYDRWHVFFRRREFFRQHNVPFPASNEEQRTAFQVRASGCSGWSSLPQQSLMKMEGLPCK